MPPQSISRAEADAAEVETPRADLERMKKLRTLVIRFRGLCLRAFHISVVRCTNLMEGWYCILAGLLERYNQFARTNRKGAEQARQASIQRLESLKAFRLTATKYLAALEEWKQSVGREGQQRWMQRQRLRMEHSRMQGGQHEWPRDPPSADSTGDVAGYREGTATLGSAAGEDEQPQHPGPRPKLPGPPPPGWTHKRPDKTILIASSVQRVKHIFEWLTQDGRSTKPHVVM